jgi:hypothetical protein
MILPYRHELDFPARNGEFHEMLNEEQIALIDVLNPLNIEARYPDYKNRISQSLNRAICENLLDQVKILQQWTKEKTLMTK